MIAPTGGFFAPALLWRGYCNRLSQFSVVDCEGGSQAVEDWRRDILVDS